jgi:hypothetical protein
MARGGRRSGSEGAALLPLLALLAAAAAPRAARGCTTILVGKGATTDGSMIMARNADAGEAIRPPNLYRHEPAPKGFRFRSNDNGFELSLPRGGLGYSASPGWWTQVPGSRNPSFECCGVNSAGVSISSTETIVNSEAALDVDPLDEAAGLGEDGIVSVVLPQATSARGAAALLGELVAEKRASEGYGVVLMDEDELWWAPLGAGGRFVCSCFVGVGVSGPRRGCPGREEVQRGRGAATAGAAGEERSRPASVERSRLPWGGAGSADGAPADCRPRLTRPCHPPPPKNKMQRYFETASGSRWLARRIPDNKYFVAANQARRRGGPAVALRSMSVARGA